MGRPKGTEGCANAVALVTSIILARHTTQYVLLPYIAMVPICSHYIIVYLSADLSTIHSTEETLFTIAHKHKAALRVYSNLTFNNVLAKDHTIITVSK